MPPRMAPGPTRSRGRGGGPPSRGPAQPQQAQPNPGVPILPAAHITTVGVKRQKPGTNGRAMSVFVNAFVTSIPESKIYHYDVVISPSEKILPARLNMELIEQLQTVIAPQIFSPRAVYDTRKNLFSCHPLKLGPSNSQEFDVSLSETRPDPGARGPRVYKIRITKVAEINPEVLKRYISGKQSHDNTVLTALTVGALNVVIRMDPIKKYPFNVRSFFTDRETKDIGGGLVLWRGYFQSVRPGIDKMFVNVDIATGTMYKPGSLLKLCLEFVAKSDPNALAPSRGFPDRERLRLQRFISNLRIITNHADQTGRVRRTPRVVKKVTTAGANQITFELREGGQMTVAEYFRRVQNRPLQFPDVVCVEVGTGAKLPLEVCIVPPGQIMRKQLPPDMTKAVVEFATKKPHERLQSIRNGLAVLDYGQSEYVRQFGMNVEHAAGPLRVQARVINPPTLKYGPGSKQLTIRPANGAWNMVDKRFFKPAAIDRWVVVIYERKQRFGDVQAQEMINGLVTCCQQVGIAVRDPNPIVRWENGQGIIRDQLRAAGQACAQRSKGPPTLMVIILPDSGNDIYVAVKHFGDIEMGVATQCMKAHKCSKAKPQFFANVCLKINVKLGGINTIPEPASVSLLTDPRNPTIVMGADVIHPAPGSEGRPSFTALVGNVDSDTAKYIADCRVQTSREEMIEDLQVMAKHILTMYMRYREMAEKKGSGSAAAPKRIIFYRDGVSEGQFKQVLERELPLLQNACKELGIKPTITVIIVGKRHHIRFFPEHPNDADRSGNCPAGTVVDREIAHPTEFDFYLQSHGGLLGTSRPAHYNVLYDENNFTADGLQSLSFALCHVYARSTRSVSIPAPVYYADIVCSRAKHHYDPQGSVNLSDSATQEPGSQADQTLDSFKKNFKPLHRNMQTVMYFS